MAKPNGKKCMRPDCPREQNSRGLCNACYNAAKGAVRKGWATWQRLEDEGKILPKRSSRSAAAWPWLLDWCKDPVVERQIALGPIPPERPTKKRSGWPKGKPRKPKGDHVSQAQNPPLAFTRPGQ